MNTKPEPPISAEDRAGLVKRPIRYVKQGDETGCAMACVAMVLGITYEEARERFGDPGNGWSPYRWEEELSRAGWAWQFYWRGDQRTNSRRDPWPLAPWADLHMLGVRGGRHQAIMLRDGTVLDPWDEGRRSLDFYGPDDIAWMAALYPVDQTAAAISTLAARVEEAESRLEERLQFIKARAHRAEEKLQAESLSYGESLAREDEWAEVVDGLKARAQAAEASLEKVTAERDEATKLMLQYAREAGEAKGRLEMSEAAGIVDGWRERAEAAEAETARMRKALEEIAQGRQWEAGFFAAQGACLRLARAALSPASEGGE